MMPVITSAASGPSGPSELIDHPLLAELWSYWTKKRGERAAMRRADLAPYEIPALLPHLTIVETAGDGRLRYRLMGTAVVEAYGFDGRGRYLDEVLRGHRLTTAAEHFEIVFETGRPILARTHYISPAGVPYVATQLGLPLADARDRLTIALVGHNFARSDDWMLRVADLMPICDKDEYHVL